MANPLIRLTRDWLRVSGPDTSRFLQGMWTCDLKRAGDLSRNGTQPVCGEGFLLTNKGKPVAPAVFLTVASDEFLLSIPGGFGAAVHAALDHYLVADEVEIASATGWNAVAYLASPVAASARRVPLPVPEAKDELFFATREGESVLVPRGRLSATHVELWRRGEIPSTHGEISPAQYLRARIDAGVPEWGVDYGPEDLILEFPHLQAISFYKGCYIGQEVVARATHRGKINRALSRFEGEEPLEAGLVYSENDPERAIGKLTSVSGTLALGLVRLAALGNENEPAGRLFVKTAAGTVLIRSVTPLL